MIEGAVDALLAAVVGGAGGYWSATLMVEGVVALASAVRKRTAVAQGVRMAGRRR